MTSIDPEQLERLVKSNEDQAAAADRFSMAMVEYQERARLAKERDDAAKDRDVAAQRRDKRLLVAVVVGLGLIALILLAGVIFLAVRQAATNDSSKSARDTILDCVQPTGECAQRSAAQQAAIVANLNAFQLSASVTSSVCALHYADLPIQQAISATQHCVNQYIPQR